MEIVISNIKTWLNHEIQTSDNQLRYIFCGLKEKMLLNLYASFIKEDVGSFMDNRFLLFLKNDAPRMKYTSINEVTWINTEDLLEARNKKINSKDIKFLVFIPSDTDGASNDSLDTTSVIIQESDKSYVDYIINKNFIENYNFDSPLLLSKLSEFYFKNFNKHTDIFFSKEIGSDSILEFFGIIGERKHFDENLALSSSAYFKGFIKRIKFFLYEKGFNGLLERLISRDVENAELVIEKFKAEKDSNQLLYEQAKDFQAELELVFLRNTSIYKSLINVDEWIEALKDEETKNLINFTNKENEISFGILDVANVPLIENTEKYILQRAELSCFLDSRAMAKWNDNTNTNVISEELNIDSKNTLNKIQAKIFEDSISTTIVNYELSIPDENKLDFGLAINLSKEKSSLNSKVKRSSKSKISELDLNSIFDEIVDAIHSVDKDKNLHFNYHFNENTLFFTLSEKSLNIGSSLNFILRTIDKNTIIKYLGYQDKEGDINFSFDEKNDIKINSTLIRSDYSISDHKFSLNNLNEGQLFILLENSITHSYKWIVIEIHTEGIRKELWVSNYYSYLQAKNDSKVSNYNIQITKRQNNLIHQFYFGEQFNEINLYPSIFYLNDKSKLVSNSNQFPVFSTTNLELQSEFRPDLNGFVSIFQSVLFIQFVEKRNLLLLQIQNEFKRTSITSFDEIEIDKVISFIDVNEYLKIYNQLLKTYKEFIWFDIFYIMEKHEQYDRLADRPIAMFFSPLHPVFLFQYLQKAILLAKTINEYSPNSLASVIKLNNISNWIICKKELLPVHYNIIETDSLLFTGYIDFSKLSNGSNSLSRILKNIGVNFNPNIGHLSPSQIRSALNKSYTYLSNKTVFNIKLVGQLTDISTNTTILNWIHEKTKEMLELYQNFKLQVNVFDDRNESCYPDSNTIIYFREELSLNFNWYRGAAKEKEFDVTLITSRQKDLQGFNQTDSIKLADTIDYSGLAKYSLNIYNSNKVYTDLYYENHSQNIDFVEINNSLTTNFKKSFIYNQIESNLSFSNLETEVLAISSDVLNAQMLQKSTKKSLWEFSISDYSFDDQGRGDYFLLAKEQEIYSLKLKKFLLSIDPEMQDRFDEFLSFSKETGLFELKYLISNDNFLKGFIASVISFKLINGFIYQSYNDLHKEKLTYKVITSYDVFKDRIHQIKKEINPQFKEFGTQFPDFIFLEFGMENGKGIINFRLVEIKYRTEIIREEGPNSISEILNDQTLSTKKIFHKLNQLRESIEDMGLWNHTLSLLLSEFVYYFHENSSFKQEGLISAFNEIINSNYELRLNDSLLICIDGTPNISSGNISNVGLYFKIPKNRINEVFDIESPLNLKFHKLFNELETVDTSSIFNLGINKNALIEKRVSKDENLNYKQVVNSENDSLNNNLVDYVFEDEIPCFSDEVDLSLENQIHNIAVHDSKSETTVITPNNSVVNEIIFGKDNSNRKAVYFPLGRPGGAPLPNYNVMVTGSSGKGKTQFIKSFIYQQAKTGKSFTIIDFKNDYSDSFFCSMTRAHKIEVKFEGIPYNPLIPRMGIRDNGDKFFDVSEHINSICAVLANTFGLGVQQEADLKKAVRNVYKSQGINPQGILEFDHSIVFPSFNDVGLFLQDGDKELEKLYNRLDPLFDLNLFRDRYKSIGFEDVIHSSNIIKLSDIQNDKIKNAIAKMIVVSAHGYYLSLPHCYNLNKLFVFDEAHRILDTDFVEKFIRECRSFGVGVLLSSQQTDDFPENVLGQLATKIIHGNDGDARLTKKIKSLLSFSGDEKVIQELATFDAIINSQDYQNWVIQTLAWPQLLLLNGITENPSGLTIDQIRDYGISVGINKDWEQYVLMLIKKQYIKKIDDLYFAVY